MMLSVLGQFCINLKTTMLQCEAGYHSCADKRIEIAEHLRYLPMGFFNRNSLGSITNVTTNTLEALGDIATRIVMVTTQGILTTAVIAVFVLCLMATRPSSEKAEEASPAGKSSGFPSPVPL